MSRSRKPKNVSNSITYRGFFNLPNALLNSPDFINLSAKAVKLLIDMGEQYNGRNNGDLCPSITLMKKRGWKSRDQLNKAKKELIERNWIEQTRQGGLNSGPNLYALTWQPIDECGGKIDTRPTTTASRSLSK